MALVSGIFWAPRKLLNESMDDDTLDQSFNQTNQRQTDNFICSMTLLRSKKQNNQTLVGIESCDMNCFMP
jgi:hypothetical protein